MKECKETCRFVKNTPSCYLYNQERRKMAISVLLILLILLFRRFKNHTLRKVKSFFNTQCNYYSSLLQHSLTKLKLTNRIKNTRYQKDCISKVLPPRQLIRRNETQCKGARITLSFGSSPKVVFQWRATEGGK